MSDSALEIQSHQGKYVAHFGEGLFHQDLSEMELDRKQFIVDAKVASLYHSSLARIVDSGRCLLIDATEENKSLDRFTGYIEKLAAQGARRGDTLVAVGGGITQDITCFIAATMFRGLDWIFYPTTLLAQADSCIGSKSSINVGEIKNLLGTFTPPKKVTIDTSVLQTLSKTEILSGIGEMLKIHIIDGPASFAAISAEYDSLLADPACLLKYIHRSLEIKKKFIEVDEFDRGIRNILNYGHSFGHAIEAATDFGIPHGIAVSMGMDMANFIAQSMKLCPSGTFEKLHGTLRKNFTGYEAFPIPMDRFLSGLSKDKKNTSDRLGLILPGQDTIPARGFYPKNSEFIGLCETYLQRTRSS